MFINTMYKKMDTVILKHPREAFINQQFLNEDAIKCNYLQIPNFELAVEEYELFLEKLSNHVENIYFLSQNENVSIDSIYAHDPVKFTPTGAIILKSGKEIRASEAIEYKKFLSNKGIPIIGELVGDARCDGGDIVWIDMKTVAIGRGYRTNDEAIRQLKIILKPFVEEIKIVQLPHDLGEDNCLHLMSFLSIIDERKAVVYSRLMPVELRQYLINEQFELFEVSDEEYETLGCNVLAIGPSKCMIVEGNPEITAKLKNHGIEVITYKGNEISVKGTGGPTCLTSPVIRK